MFLRRIKLLAAVVTRFSLQKNHWESQLFDADFCKIRLGTQTLLARVHPPILYVFNPTIYKYFHMPIVSQPIIAYGRYRKSARKNLFENEIDTSVKVY